MKRIVISKKGMLVAAASALMLAPFIASELMVRKTEAVNNLAQGSNTCFTRVGQSFTALMIGDFSSAYLSKNFTQTTGECFAQLNSAFDAAFAGTFAQAKRPLNKLVSDLFWFHEKTLKLAEMAQAQETTLSSDSTILNKFSSLEALNMDFQDKLDAKVSQIQLWRNISGALSLFGAFSVAMLALAAGRSRRRRAAELELFNSEAKEVLEEARDLDKAVLKAGRIMDALFAKIHAPYCAELYNKVVGDLLERGSASGSRQGAYNEASEEKRASKESAALETVEKVSFGKTARALAERAKENILSGNILLEQELEENFLVKGNSESLEQLLHTLISFAAESAEKNAQSGEVPKIRLKSKSLGGIAYFKAKVSNYMLNPDEMEVFNGGNPSAGANVNLLLLKEIAADMQVSVAAKNIINNGVNSDAGLSGCEIELVFTRVKEESEASNKKTRGKKLSLVKGSKRDVLKALRPEA